MHNSQEIAKTRLFGFGPRIIQSVIKTGLYSHLKQDGGFHHLYWRVMTSKENCRKHMFWKICTEASFSNYCDTDKMWMDITPGLQLGDSIQKIVKNEIFMRIRNILFYENNFVIILNMYNYLFQYSIPNCITFYREKELTNRQPSFH